MHTVVINTDGRNSSYEQFENEFLNICRRHREDNRALVFAFILYDFENAQISKIINDPDYWLSLHAISGDFLTVFSFHYKPEDIKTRLMASMNKKMNSGSSKQLEMIPTFQNPANETNKLIQKYFGNDIKIKYPSVLFFQTKGSNVSDYRMVQLEEKQIEASFLELRKYIEVAADALKNVYRENKNNVDDLFNLVDSSVLGTRQTIQVKKGIKKITSIVDLVSAVVGLKP